MTFDFKNSGKKIPAKIYPDGFYEEILECYEYETKNPTIYGNVIFGKMEHSKSGKKRWINGKRNENHL